MQMQIDAEVTGTVLAISKFDTEIKTDEGVKTVTKARMLVREGSTLHKFFPFVEMVDGIKRGKEVTVLLEKSRKNSKYLNVIGVV